MKKTYLLLLLLQSIAFVSFAQRPTYNFTFKIKGMEDGKKIYLAYYLGYKNFMKFDSSNAENGVINFKGTEPLKGGIYLLVLSPDKYYDFAVSGTETEIIMEADTSDYVKTVKFTNSKENDMLFTYRKYLSSKSEEAMEIQKLVKDPKDEVSTAIARTKMQALQTEVSEGMKKMASDYEGTFAGKIIKANLEPEIPKEAPLLANGKRDSTFLFNTYKRKFFENIDFSDERMLRTPFLESKVEKYFENLVYQITDSIIVDADKVIKLAKANKEVHRYVLYLINSKYENTKIVGLDGVFVHLVENHYLQKDVTWLDSTLTAKFKDRLATLKPIVTGKIMPSLILSDTLGVEMNLKDIKAKYTIVYFYSPDCGHCKDKAPELAKYYEENKSKGIEVLNIATKHDLDEMKKFIKTYNTDKMPNLWDPKFRYDFLKNFDVYSTPTTYILDENKRILGKRVEIEEFNKFIEFHDRKKEEEKKKKM